MLVRPPRILIHPLRETSFKSHNVEAKVYSCTYVIYILGSYLLGT